ncbi:beta-lactamase-like protein [Syncephalis plumigaleata]|nr:beta-lactamase-like protein [Syncephalis plumigaleata]
MRIHCYGKDRPWFLLELDDVRILLDAGLDVHRLENTASTTQYGGNDAIPSNAPITIDTKEGSVATAASKLDGIAGTSNTRTVGRLASASFPLPELPQDIDLSTVDIWLLSNYWQAAALPYLTERHHFQGRILATEPTVIFARIYMEELCKQFGLENARQQWDEVTIPTSNYRSIYTKDDIERSLARVQEIRYHEHVRLVSNISVIAYSSGYCLGSANWRICRESLCLAYVSSSSMMGGLHPMAFESSVFDNPLSVALVADIRRDPAMPVASMMERFKDHVSTVIRRGGNLLLPMYPHGVHFDLLMILTNLLEKANLFTPIFVISSMGDRSRLYSDILGEWMQSPYRDRMYVPENPLIDDSLVKSGRISYYPEFNTDFMQRYREPCIVFAGDPSLCAGPVVHMLSMWKNNTKNAIIFTDPRIDTAEAIQPFGTVMAEVIKCPIDLRLTPEICRQSLPSHLPDNARYLVPEHIYSHTREQPGPRVTTYKPGDTLHLDHGLNDDTTLNGTHDRQAWMSESVARQLWLRPIGANVEVAQCAATLSWRHGELFIEPLTEAEQQQLALLDSTHQLSGSSSAGRSLYGNIPINDLLHRMEHLRMQQITVDGDANLGEDVSIQAQWNNAHIRLMLGRDRSQLITDNEMALQVMTQLLKELLVEL